MRCINPPPAASAATENPEYPDCILRAGRRPIIDAHFRQVCMNSPEGKPTHLAGTAGEEIPLKTTWNGLNTASKTRRHDAITL
jgi:hypothetical protein